MLHEIVLKHSVYLRGHDFYGRAVTLAIYPNFARTGWLWRTRERGDVPVIPELMECRNRRVALVHKENTFECFEHMGILHAMGVRHIIFELLETPRVRTWPPHDGCSSNLWRALMVDGKVEKGAELRPYAIPIDTSITAYVPEDSERSINYRPPDEGQHFLKMTGYINYRLSGKYRFGMEHPNTEDRHHIYDIMSARTLGWPTFLRPLSWAAGMVGWPHHKSTMWFGVNDKRNRLALAEVGAHRMLDCLAILTFAAPHDAYLTGKVHTVKGNHETDVALLKNMHMHAAAFRPQRVVSHPRLRLVANS